MNHRSRSDDDLLFQHGKLSVQYDRAWSIRDLNCHEHNAICQPIAVELHKLRDEIQRRMSAPAEPRPWSGDGPQCDCFAWWYDRWVALKWTDPDVDCTGGYESSDGGIEIDAYGEPTEFDVEPPTHWLPQPQPPHDVEEGASFG